MSKDVFFVSWELWQQMTFILAMGIVAVFCAGLIKLWWNNRLMRKQEILDEEKRARYTEMRRSGIPVKRGNDVPFGVRAIQRGVEVDGIWISRPATPNETAAAKLASSTTLGSTLDPDSQRRGGKFAAAEDQKTGQVTTVNHERTTAPKHSPSDGSIFQRLTDAESMESTPAGTPPVSQFASHHLLHHPPRKHALRSQPSILNEDTLRRLEGQTHAQPHHTGRLVYETYIPTSAPRNPRRPSQRSSASSSGESMDSQPTRSGRSASGKSYTSSRSSRLYMATGARSSHGVHENSYRPGGGAGGYNPVSQTWVPEEREHHHHSQEHYETGIPTRTPSGLTAFSYQSDTQVSPSVAASQELPMPEPTFGPGDFHVNRATRRVNNGFEVLPAGTFGILPHHQDFGLSGSANLESVEEGGQQYNGNSRIPRGANRLKKRAGNSAQGHGQ